MCTLHEFYCGVLKEIYYQKLKATHTAETYCTQKQNMTIEIRPGYGEHTTLRYPGRGNESFGSQPSDLIIKFKLLPEANNYTRNGEDLIYLHTCTLTEALELNAFTVQTLDSRLLNVTPTETVTPQTELCFKGEGMARCETGDIVMDTQTQLKPKQAQERGNLIIKFNIVFPRKILTHHREAMIEALSMN